MQSRASLARVSAPPIMWGRNNNQGGDDNSNDKTSRSLRGEPSCLLLVSWEALARPIVVLRLLEDIALQKVIVFVSSVCHRCCFSFSGPGKPVCKAPDSCPGPDPPKCSLGMTASPPGGEAVLIFLEVQPGSSPAGLGHVGWWQPCLLPETCSVSLFRSPSLAQRVTSQPPAPVSQQPPLQFRASSPSSQLAHRHHMNHPTVAHMPLAFLSASSLIFP